MDGILRKKMRLAIATLFCCVAVPVLAASVSPYNISYSGRIVSSSGQPLSGPVDLNIAFFTAVSSGTQKGTTYGFTSVTLSDGLFQVTLAIDPADFTTIFGGTTPTWVQVTDVTNLSAPFTYPRQMFTAIPYAIRLPVDDVTVTFNASGQLSLNNSAASGAQIIAAVNSSSSTINSARLPALAGDVTGALGSTTVAQIQNKPVSAPGGGDSGKFLQYDGTGFVMASISGSSGGTVTSVTAAAPISVTSATSTPSLTLPRAASGQDGYLAASDWAAFNVKQNILGYAPLSRAGDTMSGPLTMGVGAELRLMDGNGAYHFGLKAPISLPGNITFTVPTVDGSPGQVLTTDGAGRLSFVSVASAPVSSVAGRTGAITLTTADVAEGSYVYFTNVRARAALSANAPLTYDNGTGQIQMMPSAVTAGSYSRANITVDTFGRLISASNGTSAQLSTGDVSGVLAVANGGTGGTLYSPNAIMLGGSPLSSVGPLTNGQLLVGSTGNAPVAATLTAGTGISITPAAGAITIAETVDASTKVSKAGDTMSGRLSLPNDGLMVGASQLVAIGGNVGIGTTAPINNLQLGNQSVTATTTPMTLSLGATYSSTAGANPKLKIYDYPGYTYGIGVSYTQMDYIAPPNGRHAWFVGGGQKLIIDAMGNIGIGLATPSAKLHIAGTPGTDGIMFPDGSLQTTAAAGGGTVTGIATGTGLTGGPLSATGTIALANTTVAPGSYTRSNIIVDAQGRLTAASSGTAIDLTSADVSGTLGMSKGGLGLTTGTQGGIPYFASPGAMATSGLLTAKGILLGGGTSAAPTSTAALTDGQVLIGSTGNAPLPATLTAGTGISITPAAGSITIAQSVDPLTKVSKAGDTMTGNLVFSSGYVGVGTTSPSAKLQVNLLESSSTLGSTANQLGLAILNTDGSNNNWSMIGFMDTPTLASAGIAVQTTDHTNHYGDFAVATRGTSGWGERMRVTAAGNLGIGAVNPSNLLDVRGNIVTNSAYGFYSSLTVPPNVPSYISAPMMNAIAFTTAASERMRIAGNGNVGIGLAVPNAKLSVAGTIESTAGGFRFPDGSVQTVAATGGGGAWSTLSSNTYYNSGNVGIGTSQPAYVLHVASGTVKLADAIQMTPQASAPYPCSSNSLGTMYVNTMGNLRVCQNQPTSSGLDNYASAIAVASATNIYVGGTFATASGTTVNKIARWNGSSWNALDSGMSDVVSALTLDNSGNLYAGGSFTTAGAVTANHVAKWDGSTWSALGSGQPSGQVYALTFDSAGTHLYAAGNFSGYVSVWNGSTWSMLGPSPNNSVWALAADGAGNIYVGGSFTAVGATSLGHIAKWDGSAWSVVGTGVGMNGDVQALKWDANASVLYAGGGFTSVDGITANYIAKWNGSTWIALGTGMDSSVKTLALDNSSNLYAGGYFNTAGGLSSPKLAMWNGSWNSLNANPTGEVKALGVDSSYNVYATGNFVMIGGITSNYFAKWNQTIWSTANVSSSNYSWSAPTN